MSSLKGRLSAVKGKYYGDGMADQLGRPGTGGGANEAFNLDAMPEAPLPPGWEARLSRSKGKVYFCNPSLKLTQWDRPTVESLKAKKQAAAAAQRAR
uniref:WW domain-containing protein n=1 Tax=Globisporangium ultimum (strain ATCC 200006 / CBS 805.95 / DAOM BR144) TaxID=431595 RepID=K3X4E6_GLOUD